ncbi:MAG: phosphate-starvation-inducible PsiE family protein [Methylobacterium frigidaeris]
MAQDADEEGGRLTRLSAFVFLHTEHAIYAALGVLLALTAVMALVDAAGMTGKAIVEVGGAAQLLDVVDRLLFLLMLVELLHTVRVSMRSGRLTCEPFLIVGLIASIRRVLVLTLQTAEAMHDADWTPQKEALFRASMIELGVLALLILTMVVSIFLLHRARGGDQPAGVE